MRARPQLAKDVQKGQSLHSFEWYKPRNISKICIQVKCIYKPYVSSSLNMHSIPKYVFYSEVSILYKCAHCRNMYSVNVHMAEMCFEFALSQNMYFI